MVGGTLTWLSKTQESTTLKYAGGTYGDEIPADVNERNPPCGSARNLDEDNIATISFMKNHRVGQRTKQIDICWHYI
jgi:hypothetical protein